MTSSNSEASKETRVILSELKATIATYEYTLSDEEARKLSALQGALKKTETIVFTGSAVATYGLSTFLFPRLRRAPKVLGGLLGGSYMYRMVKDEHNPAFALRTIMGMDTPIGAEAQALFSERDPKAKSFLLARMGLPPELDVLTATSPRIRPTNGPSSEGMWGSTRNASSDAQSTGTAAFHGQSDKSREHDFSGWNEDRSALDGDMRTVQADKWTGVHSEHSSHPSGGRQGSGESPTASGDERARPETLRRGQGLHMGESAASGGEPFWTDNFIGTGSIEEEAAETKASRHAPSRERRRERREERRKRAQEAESWESDGLKDYFDKRWEEGTTKSR